MIVVGLDVPRFASRRGARDLHSNAVAAPGNSCAGRFMSQCRGRRPLILRTTRGHTHHEAWRPVAFCATSGLITLARRWFPACEVPFLTDDARQFGRGRVCACPYQGASRGCRPGDGAARVSLRPVPNGPRRSAHPKRRSPGALDPKLERAILFAIRGPAHSRPSIACGGLSARRGILAANVGGCSLSIARRREFGDQAARDLAELSPRLLSGGLRHARQIGGVDVRKVGEVVPAFGGIVRECGN